MAASKVRFWVSFGMGNYCCIWAFWPFEFCVVYCISGHFKPLGIALASSICFVLNFWLKTFPLSPNKMLFCRLKNKNSGTYFTKRGWHISGKNAVQKNVSGKNDPKGNLKY